MAVTAGKKKKPPTFHYLPKSLAKQHKKSWVDDRKIRSRWKAQKKREGLTNQTSLPVEDSPSHVHDEINTNSQPTASSNCPDESPIPSPSSHHKTLRDLRKIAYASKPRHTQKIEPPHKRHPRSGKAAMERDAGQPNMKLRMNVLLEKIKRDLAE